MEATPEKHSATRLHVGVFLGAIVLSFAFMLFMYMTATEADFIFPSGDFASIARFSSFLALAFGSAVAFGTWGSVPKKCVSSVLSVLAGIGLLLVIEIFVWGVTMALGA